MPSLMTRDKKKTKESFSKLLFLALLVFCGGGCFSKKFIRKLMTAGLIKFIHIEARSTRNQNNCRDERLQLNFHKPMVMFFRLRVVS